MAFNNQNTVKHFIIHQLTGVNLNAVKNNIAKEDGVGENENSFSLNCCKRV